MDTLATIGFKADTNDLVKADKALDNLEKSAAATESQVKQTNSAMTSMGAAAAAQSTGVMKMIASLDDQVATLGMTNKELLLYRAAQNGATEADKQAIVAAVNKIEAYERATLATRNQAVAAETMGRSVGQNRAIMQSFGYQLQDTIVQAQMGANAFMILSQQGSQMASAFGPSGAVVGALIAVAGVVGMVLAPSLLDSKTEAEKLTEQMDRLGEAAQRNESGVLTLTDKITELAKQSKLAADSQLQIEILLAEKAMKQASLAAVDMIDSLTGAGDILNDSGDAFKYVGTSLEAVIYQTPALTRVVKDIGEKFGATGTEARDLGVEILRSVKAMGEVKDPAEISRIRDSLIGTAKAAKLTGDQLIQFVGSINEFATGAINAAEAAKLFSDAVGTDNTQAAKSATDKLEELTQQTALAREEFLYGEAAAQKLALAFELGLRSASELTPELAAQVDELIKWSAAGKEVEKQLKRIAKLEDDANAIFEAEEKLLEIQKKRIERKEKEIEAYFELRDAADTEINKIASLSEKAAERIEAAFADAWMNAFDGFESVVDGMKNAFKRMLAEMAHMALTKPIMVSLGMGDMMGAGSAGSSAISSALGKNALFASVSQYLGPMAIVASLGSMLSKALGGTGKNGALFGGLTGGLLGSWKTESDMLSLGVSGGDVTGSQTTTNVKKKFFKNRRESFTSDFDTSEIDAAFDAIGMALSDSAKMFGITGADEIIKGFSAAANIDIKGKSQEEVQAAIAEWVGNTTSALVDAVFGDSLDGLQKEGEGVIDTVSRLSANMGAVQAIAKGLGLNFELTGRAAMLASTSIVELAGGIEQLSALTSQYYSAFYSETEQQALLYKQLTESFAALNMSLPESREGFKAVIDGLDLTTDAGQKLFAELMKLVPGLDQYLSGVEALTAASKEAAEAEKAKAEALKAQGLDLQLRLYDALGQSSEALALRRQMEIEATDASLHAILQQIYAAQDAASAQRELADAQSAAASSARDAAAAAIGMAQNAFGKLQDAAQAEKDRLETELDLKLSNIDKEREALEAQRDSVIDGYREQGRAVADYVKRLEGLSGVINDFLGQTGAAEDPFKRLGQIFNEVKAGLLPEQGDLQAALSGVANAGTSGFGSASDAAFAMAVARNQASQIGGIIGGRASGARSQAQLIEQQITDAEKYFTEEMLKLDAAESLAKQLHDEQVGKIDEQLSEAQKQLNALMGVDDRILTMTEAAAEFYAALESANSLQLVTANEQVAAINRVELAVLGLGSVIAEAVTPAPAPLDRPFDAPIPVGGIPAVGEPVTREMVELLKELVAAADATAKHTKTSANVLELNQYEAQELNP